MMNVRRRVVASLLAVVLVASNAPVFAAVFPIEQRGAGAISGWAQNALGKVTPNVALRLRNMQTGQLAGSTRAGWDGQFSFAALGAGMYVVEILNANGDVLSTSAPIVLAASAMVATDRKLLAAGVAQGTGTSGGGSFWGSTAGIVTIAAISAGIVGVTVAATKKDKKDKSPHK